MTITLQIPDTVYTSLLNGTHRIQGTIALVSPTEGNFNAHRRYLNESPERAREYKKLPHGRISINKDTVRLSLNIGLDEAEIYPSIAILNESLQASDFVKHAMTKGGVA